MVGEQMKNPLYRTAVGVGIYAIMYEVPHLVRPLPDAYFWACVFVSGAVPLLGLAREIRQGMQPPHTVEAEAAPAEPARSEPRADEIPPYGEAPAPAPEPQPGTEPESWESLFK